MDNDKLRLSRLQALLTIKVVLFADDKDKAACAFQRRRFGMQGVTLPASCLDKEGLHGTHRKSKSNVPGCRC